MSKKKILLLGDDIRLPSGVGTMSRQIILKSLYKYDWIQLAGALKSPDAGKVVDLCDNNDIKKESGVQNPYLKLFPVNGYGDKNVLNQVGYLTKESLLSYLNKKLKN